MNFKKNMQDSNVGFQLAPMVDIVFLLLIFFMVASVFAQWETKIGIKLPTADSGIRNARLPGEIIVNMDNKNKIYINSIEVSPNRLKTLLGNVANRFPGQAVIIRADRYTNYETVVQVLDICKTVDIWNVSFSTLPEKN
ncbi:MAG: biopolymer transporter ExbD [Verrucomicrobiota bacterium]|nr:biopolymer transporter ExbD [Verrucomicrobiota bacterium]